MGKSLNQIVVRVRYYNILRRRAGMESEQIALPYGTDLNGLVQHLAQGHGPGLAGMLLSPSGEIALHLVIYRNSELVPTGQYDSSLADGDDIKLFLSVAGGQ